MYKKTSKSLVFMGAMLVFSFLLVSCQSMLVSTEEMERSKAVEAWGANLTAQGERYLKEMEQASVPLIELGSDVPAQAAISTVMVDAYKPGIEIRRTRLAANTYLVVYTVKSDRPAWVVFHEDDNGAAGAIIQYIFVESGTQRIAKTEVLGEMSSRQIHVMLHEDLGRIGLFEFPGSDGPVFVENEIVNELCFCPF
jgi:hypothetical protein